MFKRTWIGLMLMLGIGLLVLSACGSGDLAKDLTPIPTLPPGAEPELKEAVSAALAGGDEDIMDQAALVAIGEQLFTTNCAGCHGAADGVGPALTGMGQRAAERVAGLSSEEYLLQAIVEPGEYVVEGYNNIMPADYGTSFSEDELKALVAYILADSQASEEIEGAAGDPENGAALFVKACAGCHGAEDGVGPALTGMGERAAERDEDLSAEEYLLQAIVEPDAFLVEGYNNIMPPTLGDQYTDQELNDLVAYMLTQ